jgi:hypothetical protein
MSPIRSTILVAIVQPGFDSTKIRQDSQFSGGVVSSSDSSKNEEVVTHALFYENSFDLPQNISSSRFYSARIDGCSAVYVHLRRCSFT